MQEQEKTRYYYFSQEAAEKYGYVVGTLANGQKITFTMSTEKESLTDQDYGFKDKAMVFKANENDESKKIVYYQKIRGIYQFKNFDERYESELPGHIKERIKFKILDKNVVDKIKQKIQEIRPSSDINDEPKNNFKK